MGARDAIISLALGLGTASSCAEPTSDRPERRQDATGPDARRAADSRPSPVKVDANEASDTAQPRADARAPAPDRGGPDASPASARDASPASVADASSTNPLAGIGPVELVASGLTKADTPTWLAREQLVVFPSAGNLMKLVAPRSVSLFLEGRGGRCTTGPDGALYVKPSGGLGRIVDGTFELLAATFADGAAISVNDLVVSSKGIVYFSSLKDPDPKGLGRLSLLRLADRQVAVQWAGANEPLLQNPNGVAIAPKEDFLYVGVSIYANTAASGIYRFPLGAEGSLDVAAGKARKWGNVKSPDGLAVDQLGNVYATAGSAIQVLGPEGKSLGSIKLPAGPATNLGFGGTDMKTLYVTTNTALYQLRTSIAGTRP